MGRRRRKNRILKLDRNYRNQNARAQSSNWRVAAGIGGAAVLVLAVVIAAVLLRGCSSSPMGPVKEPETETEEIQIMESETAEAVEEEEQVEALAKNIWPEVNELVAQYFTALQSGDGETLKLLRDNTEAKELLRMQLNGEYIEAYKNLACYTKSGLVPDSYVVFAYYEVKFVGHETLLPGISPLYVCRNEEGNLYLHDLTVSDEISQYVSEITAQEDVAEFYSQVSADYQAALAADESLASFVAEYSEKMKKAVGEALEEESREQQTAAGEESGDDGEQTAAGMVPESGIFEVSDTINVRKSASEDAERIGVCYPGEKLEILIKQSDGWTKVKFNGETGYVKTSVLK